MNQSTNPSNSAKKGTTTQSTSFEEDIQSKMAGKESIPIPQLAPEAFHGPIGRISQAIGPHTEADISAVHIQLLVAFGNAIGHGPFFKTDGTEHSTNEFCCIVGKSSKSRKGTSWGYARTIMREIDRQWAHHSVKSGLSSGEGLIYHVRDAVKEMQRDKKTGVIEEVELDHGVADKRLLSVETEFARVFDVMNRQGNTLSTTVRDAWDTGNLNSLVKNSPVAGHGAHISIIGHITLDELKRRMKEAEYFNGFGNRFPWVIAQRSKLLPYGGSFEMSDIEDEIKALRDAFAWAKDVEENGTGRTGECSLGGYLQIPECRRER